MNKLNVSVLLVGDRRTMVLVGGNPMSVTIMGWNMATMDLGLEVGVRRCTMERTVWNRLAHSNHIVRRPSHGRVLGSRRRLVIVRVRGAIVDIVGVHALLV